MAKTSMLFGRAWRFHDPRDTNNRILIITAHGQLRTGHKFKFRESSAIVWVTSSLTLPTNIQVQEIVDYINTGRRRMDETNIWAMANPGRSKDKIQDYVLSKYVEEKGVYNPGTGENEDTYSHYEYIVSRYPNIEIISPRARWYSQDIYYSSIIGAINIGRYKAIWRSFCRSK